MRHEGQGKTPKQDSTEAAFDPTSISKNDAEGASRRFFGKRLVKIFIGGIALVFVIGAIIVSAWTAWLVRDLSFAGVNPQVKERAVVMSDVEGQPIYRQGKIRRMPVKLEDLPPSFVPALLAIEDRRFFQHFGIDPVGIARAFVANTSVGEVVQGGSTLTQQLVRAHYLDDDRTIKRKVREAALSVWLDAHYDKNAILEGYLNTIYFGSGAYGLVAAARRYFDKDVSDLTLAESAMLTGLIRAPARLNPLSDLDASRERARVVLNAMVEVGSIDQDEADRAGASLANIEPQISSGRLAGSWYGDWVGSEVDQFLEKSGLTDSTRSVQVRTSLEPSMQEFAQEIVSRVIRRNGPAYNATEAALVAMRTDGTVLAMVGGTDYTKSQFNRAVQAKRQPGSLFKLIVYYTALRNGWRLNDFLVDAPIDIDGWEPKNFDHKYKGRITLLNAFAQSRNIPAIELAMTVGLDEVVKTARELGIEGDLLATPSLALGTSEVSLLDIVGAFASIRADRTPLEPTGISSMVLNDTGKVFKPLAGAETGRQLGSRRAALAMLRHAVERGTGSRARINGRVVGGKTGTSEDYRDAWFIGYVGDMIIGVWVGNDDNSPMRGVTGGGLPAQIWKQFVQAVDSDEGVDELPPELLFADARADLDEPVASSMCDIAACQRAYRSFRAADCTYKPYQGPRRLCTRGNSSDALQHTVRVSEYGRNREYAVSLTDPYYRNRRVTVRTVQPTHRVYAVDRAPHIQTYPPRRAGRSPRQYHNAR